MLAEKQAYEYIRHRLKVVGYNNTDLFSKKALNMIWQHSEGIPRKINILCDNVLLNAYALGQKKIKALAVAEAINDLTFGKSSSNGGKPPRHFSRLKAAML